MPDSTVEVENSVSARRGKYPLYPLERGRSAVVLADTKKSLNPVLAFSRVRFSSGHSPLRYLRAELNNGEYANPRSDRGSITDRSK